MALVQVFEAPRGRGPYGITVTPDGTVDEALPADAVLVALLLTAVVYRRPWGQVNKGLLLFCLRGLYERAYAGRPSN